LRPPWPRSASGFPPMISTITGGIFAISETSLSEYVSVADKISEVFPDLALLLLNFRRILHDLRDVRNVLAQAHDLRAAGQVGELLLQMLAIIGKVAWNPERIGNAVEHLLFLV